MEMTIYILSDDIIFENLLAQLIEKKIQNAKFRILRSSTEMNEYLTGTYYDLILVDGGLANMSAIEAIGYIRTKKQVISPIWFFTEIFTESYLQEARIIGVNRIINKPFDPYEIVEEISSRFIKQSI